MAENTLRVLVADDIASNRTIVGAFLAHLNCTPLYAVDGVEAVELFRQEAPDVVLMDLMMPRMDGFEAIRQIRALAEDHRDARGERATVHRMDAAGAAEGTTTGMGSSSEGLAPSFPAG